MFETSNLARKIEEKLPPGLVNFILTAAKTANRQSERLYLVGGVVRDLLLGQTSLDIDLVVEGDAIELAKKLNEKMPAKVTTHPQFHTARLKWQGFNIDLTTARNESYAHPGALPRVQPGSLAQDLFRRDFTVNAMAISLNSDSYGELIDLYGGRGDLEHRLIRILHEKSFTDDATRIWRAIRYGVRLGFSLEENTQVWLKRDINMLDTISGDRIRYELECVLEEAFPEKVLSLAYELGVLAKLHPPLKGNGWLAERCQMARQISAPDKPPIGLYLALITYTLNSQEIEPFVSYLHLDKSLARILRDRADLRGKLQSLADPELSSSRLYHLLHGCSMLAIQAVSLASDSATIHEHLDLYLSKLRYIRPSLNGENLKKMGVGEGPQIKEILERLLEARLDGKVTSHQEEEKMVRRWVNLRP